eukprot:g7575.t1
MEFDTPSTPGRVSIAGGASGRKTSIRKSHSFIANEGERQSIAHAGPRTAANMEQRQSFVHHVGARQSFVGNTGERQSAYHAAARRSFVGGAAPAPDLSPLQVWRAPRDSGVRNRQPPRMAFMPPIAALKQHTRGASRAPHAHRPPADERACHGRGHGAGKCCTFCNSSNLVRAVRCRFCGTWQGAKRTRLAEWAMETRSAMRNGGDSARLLARLLQRLDEAARVGEWKPADLAEIASHGSGAAPDEDEGKALAWNTRRGSVMDVVEDDDEELLNRLKLELLSHTLADFEPEERQNAAFALPLDRMSQQQILGDARQFGSIFTEEERREERQRLFGKLGSERVYTTMQCAFEALSRKKSAAPVTSAAVDTADLAAYSGQAWVLGGGTSGRHGSGVDGSTDMSEFMAFRLSQPAVDYGGVDDVDVATADDPLAWLPFLPTIFQARVVSHVQETGFEADGAEILRGVMQEVRGLVLAANAGSAAGGRPFYPSSRPGSPSFPGAQASSSGAHGVEFGGGPGGGPFGELGTMLLASVQDAVNDATRRMELAMLEEQRYKQGLKEDASTQWEEIGAGDAPVAQTLQRTLSEEHKAALKVLDQGLRGARDEPWLMSETFKILDERVHQAWLVTKAKQETDGAAASAAAALADGDAPKVERGSLIANAGIAVRRSSSTLKRADTFKKSGKDMDGFVEDLADPMYKFVFEYYAKRYGLEKITNDKLKELGKTIKKLRGKSAYALFLHRTMWDPEQLHLVHFAVFAKDVLERDQARNPLHYLKLTKSSNKPELVAERHLSYLVAECFPDYLPSARAKVSNTISETRTRGMMGDWKRTLSRSAAVARAQTWVVPVSEVLKVFLQERMEQSDREDGVTQALFDAAGHT